MLPVAGSPRAARCGTGNTRAPEAGGESGDQESSIGIMLEALIRAKRALGRPKDLAVATELDAIRSRERGSRGGEA